jgi:hypothetical protein
MCDDEEDEPAFNKYQEQVEAVADLFRRAPHNLIEEIEKLRFTYVVDDDEDAEEINEELTARPETDFQMALVSYLDGADAPSKTLLKLWREETRREDSSFPLWRRYFRTGNAQLKRLVLFGLDRYPATRDLLENLYVLHSFLPNPKELLLRYMLACDLEDDPERFRELAQDLDVGAASFGYDALHALRARYAVDGLKKKVIDGLLLDRETSKEIVAF